MQLLRFFTGGYRGRNQAASMICDDQWSRFPEQFTLVTHHEAGEHPRKLAITSITCIISIFTATSLLHPCCITASCDYHQRR
jgi:hypothetical protein